MFKTIFCGLLLCFILSSCAMTSVKNNSPGVSLIVQPLIFNIEGGIKNIGVEVFSFTELLAGANLSINVDGLPIFGLSKVNAKTLFANGPETLGISNKEFLELLMDRTRTSSLIEQYRLALDVTEASQVTTIEKGDWFFIVLQTNTGPMAYGASSDSELAFQIDTTQNYDTLVQLINSAQLIAEHAA